MTQFDYIHMDVSPPRSGKTHRLVEWMIAQPEDEYRIYATISHAAAQVWADEAMDANSALEKAQFMPIDEVFRKSLPWERGRVSIALDEPFLWLQSRLGGGLRRVAFSTTEQAATYNKRNT